MITLFFLLILAVVYFGFHYKIYRVFYKNTYKQNGFMCYLSDVSNGYIDIKHLINNKIELIIGILCVITIFSFVLGY